FRDFDDGFNSKLFAPHYCEEWKAGDKVISEVIKGLYETKDGYRYDFSVISADVLGGMYEQYLGYVQGHKSEEKQKSKRKSQGVYYTPKYIVEYLIKESAVKIIRIPQTNITDDKKTENERCAFGISTDENTNNTAANYPGYCNIIRDYIYSSLKTLDCNHERFDENNAAANSAQRENPEIQALIRDSINDLIERLRGLGHSETFEKLGVTLSVKLDWLKIIKTKLDNICFNKSENEFSTWTKPSLYARHITALPSLNFSLEKPKIWLSIDESGSMGNDDIRKIYFVLWQLNKKGYPLEIIIHDSEITKIQNFEAYAKAIDEFVKTRYSRGGTSHKAVFDHLEKNIKNRKHIVIIASDLDSDICEIYKNYSWQNKVMTIALTPSDTELPFGATVKL
ncbi:MAG TPA: hypothetical protein PKY81_09120, partial [bacterium]|nr:hypothetical protein [bacterium]